MTRYQIRHLRSGHILASTYGSMTAAEIWLATYCAHSISAYTIEPFRLMESLGFTGGELAEANASGDLSRHD